MCLHGYYPISMDRGKHLELKVSTLLELRQIPAGVMHAHCSTWVGTEEPDR